MKFRTPSKKDTNKDIEKEFKNLRKELLDLTLRNPLLNFKARNRNLNIINQSPINIYRTLVLENKKMFFQANKKETKKSKAHAFIDEAKEFLSQESDKTLKADLSPSELQKRLFYIDQQSKTMVQEQGYNILYIAIGFIEWIDNKKPRQKNLAPLILIPVEMERKKVGNSFSLSWTGEDLQNNISIQAKLREIGIELPKFEQTSYVEGVNHYLENVRQAIRPFPKWDVKYDIALGFFSFTKFVMYNDLNPESWDENIDLTKNELIQAIFNPSKNVYEDTFEEDDVDEKLHYKTMYQVLDADSSQIAAIENVKAGHNLVVEGPPGTGKSQTIVNLIAELIAEGKTVLFVSEKMAALEVVKSRLDSVGLGKFVLELHSHKTRRKKFLKNLQKATNVRSTRDLKLDQTLRKLENLRDQLDQYAEIIHRPMANVKLSPFELYGMKESSEDYFSRQNRLLPLVRFDNPEDITMKDLDDIIISLENLSELYSTISKNNPWSYCNPKSLLPADLREIEQLIRDTLEALTDFRYEMDIIKEVYGIKVPNTLQEYEDSITALSLLNSETVNLIDSSILLNREWYSNPEQAQILIKLLASYQQSSNLFDKFTDYLLIADLDTLIQDLNKDLNKKFRLFGGNSHKDELSRLYKGPVPSEKEALNDLIKVRKEIKVRQSYNDNEKLAIRYFGDLWGKNANVQELKEVSIWMRKFTHLLSNGTFNENTVKMLSNEIFHPSIDDGIDEYIEKGNRFYESLKKLESKLNPRSKIIFKKESEDVPFDKWEIQLNKWKGQLSSLHLWSQYSNTKRACMNTHASIFIKTVEKRNIKKDDVKPLVLGNFADSLLNIVFSENEILAGFIGELHENRIADFKDLDRKIINLNRKRIFNKLNSQIPKIFGGANDPEAKILAGEFTRKSGHLPVRTLLEKAGGTIKKIKPVFMMSPLSIAQYLDPTNPKLQFDVVIFDEASQVKPEDALGAFMRGKTAVVMGDTQQLPPTSFFDQMTDSEGGEEVATALDMESILHLCKMSFPVKMLKWHYRSRHESLINISNREFYDNELLVYPSPCHNDPELGLKFHYNPNTAYHRGEGSANPLEAKDVVKEIFRHFEKYGDKKSLGVGTFSVAQKNAILEELEIERKSHPEFEPLFSDKREERFFVKNLETIQGDERDVILISVGYGYDTEGKMSLNFGPLNQDGGERRLNVLITRAREKCVVFTNFRAHDIHLTANPPFGVKSLQSFLEYAENLSQNQFIDQEEDEEAPFEDAIYNFLADNGYQVDKRIGCAGFRVDLAIIDEENPGKYLLGIQCDGHNYASSKVARDRDRLREQVLNGLGWKIYHIWSTDWYRNRDLARARLLEHIENTIITTKVNDLKSKIHDAESMQINPVTTVVIDKKNKDKDSDDDSDSDKTDKNKESLINNYLKDLEDEFGDNSDKKDNNNEDDDSNNDDGGLVIDSTDDSIDNPDDEGLVIDSDTNLGSEEFDIGSDSVLDDDSDDEEFGVDSDSDLDEEEIIEDSEIKLSDTLNTDLKDEDIYEPEIELDDNSDSDLDEEEIIYEREIQLKEGSDLDTEDEIIIEENNNNGSDIDLDSDDVTVFELSDEDSSSDSDDVTVFELSDDDSSSDSDDEELDNDSNIDLEDEESDDNFTLDLDDQSNNLMPKSTIDKSEFLKDLYGEDDDLSSTIDEEPKILNENNEVINKSFDSKDKKSSKNISKSELKNQEKAKSKTKSKTKSKAKPKNRNQEIKNIENGKIKNDDSKKEQNKPKSKNRSILNRLKNIGGGLGLSRSEESEGKEFIKAEDKKSKEFVSDAKKSIKRKDRKAKDKDSNDKKEINKKLNKEQNIKNNKDNIVESDKKQEEIKEEIQKPVPKSKPNNTKELINQNNKTIEELEEYINNSSNNSDLEFDGASDIDLEKEIISEDKTKLDEESDIQMDDEYVIVDDSELEDEFEFIEELDDDSELEEEFEFIEELDDDSELEDEEFEFIDDLDDDFGSEDEYELVDDSELEDEFELIDDLEEKSNNYDNEDINLKEDSEYLEKEESEDIMRQKESVSKRKVEHEIIDDSLDVIVPISAERRADEYNNYSEDANVIIPIQDEEEFEEEYYNNDSQVDSEEGIDELEELISENINYSDDDAREEFLTNKESNQESEEDSYYYSAVGIENSLKKNAVQYPKSSNRNKKGIVGAVSSLKDEMLYINASIKEIENPTEREKIYVIDPSEEEYYNQPDDSIYYNDSLSENKERYAKSKQYEDEVEVISPVSDSDEGETGHIQSDYIERKAEDSSKSSSESLFSPKKHEYLDKIKEYAAESEYEEAAENPTISPVHTEIEETVESSVISPVHTEYVETVESSAISPVQQEYDKTEEPSTISAEVQETEFIDDILLEEDELSNIQDTDDSDLAEEEPESIEIDDDEFESIITDVDQDYQELEKERIKEANVLSAVDNTRLTPTGKLEDYIVPYKEIDDVIIKSATEIYDDEKKVATAVMDIVSAEGPIHVDMVIRRIRESCNLSRAGTKFKEAIFKAIDRNESHMNLIREEDFLFIDYDQIAVRKRDKPNIDLISDLEIEKAIDLVLSFEKSLKVKELARIVSRTLGFKSTSKKTSAKILEVIDVMIGKEILVNVNDKIEFR